MLDRSDAETLVTSRRAQLGATAGALRDRLTPHAVVSDSTEGLRRLVGPPLKAAGAAIARNPAAAALTAAGLAWMILGRRGTRPALDPQFEAVTRWEDEGGPPHPAHDTAAEELAAAQKPAPDLVARARQVAADHPAPLGLIAAALGGLLAARLRATPLEAAIVADVREVLRRQMVGPGQ